MRTSNWVRKQWKAGCGLGMRLVGHGCVVYNLLSNTRNISSASDYTIFHYYLWGDVSYWTVCGLEICEGMLVNPPTHHTHLIIYPMIPLYIIDGYSYERSAITEWFSKGRRTSPVTNLPLTNTLLLPNRALRMVIEQQRWPCYSFFCNRVCIIIFY